MDIIDKANKLADAERAAAIAKACKQARPAGTEECIVCGEEIPAARRSANPYAQRCIDCQRDYERGHVK